MTKFSLITLILSIFLCCSQAQKKPIEFDKHFTKISFDTLHVHSNLVHLNNKVNLPDNLSKKLSKQDFYPISSFYFDKKKTFIGYILSSGETKSALSKHIYLIVLNSKTAKLIFSTEIAGYEYLEGAYQKWQNAWIADFNNDSMLDIGIYKRLIDFELPNEESKNISGSEKYLLTFKNKKFNYQPWNIDILKKYSLLPKRNQLNKSMETKQITIVGTALNAKLGAVLKTENGEVFYLEGVYEWPDEVLEKEVKAIGNISSEYYDPKDLVTDDGLHKTGMSGEKLSLQNVKWELINK